MVSELVEMLKRVKNLAGAEFTGVGVIVCDVEAELPTFPLRLGVDVPQELDAATILANVSIAYSDLHDGFHVLAPDLRVVALSQYFSPPIIESAVINRTRRFGGRYIAALFGSALPSVHLCGVATDSLGIVIFKDGREIYFERS